MGLLLQGVRLAVVIRGGTGEDIATAHYLMLLIGIGSTVISAMHGILATDLQAATDENFAKTRKHAVRSYMYLSFIMGLGGVVTIKYVGPLLFSSIGNVGEVAGIVLASTLPSLCTYYCLSALSVRLGRTGRLAAVSVTGLLIFYVFVLRFPSNLDSLVILYSVAIGGLPILMSIVIGLDSAVSRKVVWKCTLGVMIGQLPVAAFLIPTLLGS
ncbi:hypothetical protein [Cryobacterium sp. N21]|uniref:hypothetical protein n=1 Tax=Cryobacterium sp. N21 TaxID=2048289 RepID=UPI001124EA42|nr:hypothetical protein [Cryobacterium sp. N21]